MTGGTRKVAVVGVALSDCGRVDVKTPTLTNVKFQCAT